MPGAKERREIEPLEGAVDAFAFEHRGGPDVIRRAAQRGKHSWHRPARRRALVGVSSPAAYIRLMEAIERRALRVPVIGELRLDPAAFAAWLLPRSEEHTSELQSHSDLVCRLLLEKKKTVERYLT